MNPRPVMRIACLIFSGLFVLPTTALVAAPADKILDIDPKKGGVEAKGPGKQKKPIQVKTNPAGPKGSGTKTAGKVVVPPSKAAVLECNGDFRGTVKVRNRLTGPARNFTVASPARAYKNVKSVKISPAKFRLKQNGLRVLDVSGTLTSDCGKGRLGILVSWPGPVKKGRKTVAKEASSFSISPLISSGYRLPVLVQSQMSARGRFNYFVFDYSLRCCPNVSGRFKVTIDRSKNVQRSTIKPSSFVCSPGAPSRKQGISFVGRLKDHSKLGTIDFKVTREGGASCLGRARISPPKRKR